jgi:hypothetical protein
MHSLLSLSARRDERRKKPIFQEKNDRKNQFFKKWIKHPGGNDCYLYLLPNELLIVIFEKKT